MVFRSTVLCFLALLTLETSSFGADKQQARIQRIGEIPMGNIVVAPMMAAADTCIVDNYDEIVYRIDSWVVGYELYKVLMDPAEDCTDPYPFTVTAVNMPMIFDDGCTIVVSADVEAVDSLSYPDCPIPGDLLSISTDYSLTVPSGGGLYSIWIPLDSAVTVNGPFFAGFYIGNELDASANAGILTDANPRSCISFNIWDESIGWVDLTSNSYYSFPGCLVMEAAGIPGGGGGGGGGDDDDTTVTTEAHLLLIAPCDGDTLFGSGQLWAWDSTASATIDYVAFEFSLGGSWIQIGRDYDGTSTLRDGLSTAEPANGFSLYWDLSYIPEGPVTLRAVAVDTGGRQLADTVDLFVEPTPPVPVINSPSNGDTHCSPLEILLSCGDEDLSYLQLYRHTAKQAYSVGLSPINQHSVGDSNGDLTDGNSVANGEYGDYYSGPVAAAIAIEVWQNRGIMNIMKESSDAMTMSSLIEELASRFETRRHQGTYDEAVWRGLIDFAYDHGNELTFAYLHYPDYFDVRTCVEDQERSALIGLSGTPGLWLAVDGFIGWTQTDGSYRVTVANPLTGSIQVAPWRDRDGYSEINVSGNWQRVDIMISMVARSWTVNRSLIAVDMNGNDGWAMNWEANGLADNEVNFLRVVGTDAGSLRGDATVMVEYDCSSVFKPGDYNNDMTSDIADLFYLIDYITLKGEPPVGGAGRADCNCDNTVNIADIVFFMNYLFGGTGPPCH